MARMVPETLRGLEGVTAGEARLFRLLQQKLDDEPHINALLGAFEGAGVPYDLVTRDRESERSFGLDAPAVKVSTIHNSTGLDFAAVVMVGVSMLPSKPASEAVARKLVYVGMTRARDALLITSCKESKFVGELRRCVGPVASAEPGAVHS